MEHQDIEKVASNALSEFTRDRMCLINGGTGNLLEENGRFFIATCYHVAEEFFEEGSYRYVILRRNERIKKDDLKLIAYKDKEIDVALIEVHATLSGYPTYKLNNIEVIETFDMEKFDKTNIVVSGNPDELSKNKHGSGILYTPLTFTTLPEASKLPCSDFLYCKYPMARDVIENQSGRRMKLPTAGGLSGAFMLKQREFASPKEQIWTPDIMKVVAIQHRWDKESYIKGTNIKYLIQLLKECGAA
jgi:hypothetical protein